MGNTADERAVVAKIRKEIESVRADLKLSKADVQALEGVMRRYLGEPRALPSGQPPFSDDLVIVGVLRDFEKDDQSMMGFTLAAQADRFDLFMSPATTERMFRHNPEWKEVGYFGVFVTVDKEENLKEVADAVDEMGLRQVSLLKLVNEIRAGVTLVTFLITFLALMAALAAVLGITNIMFMSVLERTREIGVMKAVGARDRHIQLIFLVEGALLGVLGGALGVLGAWLVSFPADAYARRLMAEHAFGRYLQQSPFVFPWWLVLGVPFFAAVVTTLAAVLPARRAAKVDPIQALRHE
jgi:putative ABC transport system permease protein